MEWAMLGEIPPVLARAPRAAVITPRRRVMASQAAGSSSVVSAW